MVARTSDSTNFGVVWDKFQVYQGHRCNTPYVRIGPKRSSREQLKFVPQSNAVKRALQYEALLTSGEVDSQTELARLSGIPRTTISAYLRLLRLDASVRSEALQVGAGDPRVALLTEARLRHLVELAPSEQRQQFRALLATAGEGVRRAPR